MAQLTTVNSNSNTYFFLSSFDDTLKAGKNAFTVNPTQYVVPNTDITVFAYDSKNSPLPCGKINPTNAKFNEQTNVGDLYYVFVSKDIASGIGRIEINGTGIDVGTYSGKIAYYNGEAYPVSNTQRLPLVEAPSASPFPKVNVNWSQNVLVDTARKTDSEVRFFDFPYIEVKPQIYTVPEFPQASYRMASGSFSSIAIFPKNNADGDYDYQFDTPIYQLYWKSGTKFNHLMQGDEVRIKGPSVKNFTYTNQSNNQISYEGKLNTDFIAIIRQVVNETTVLLDIPFSTVSDLVTRSNEDSPYSKNNIVDIKGYNTNNDPLKQTVYHKKNFYILSIDDGDFEIFYKNVPIQLDRAILSGSTCYKKSLLNVDFCNLRLLCGALSSYKIYGKSLNSPETKTLLSEGKIEPINLLESTNFDNGLYNSLGEFYDSAYLTKYWLASSVSIQFSQSNEVLINGATIGHSGNASQADYVILKDDTSVGRTSAYVNYNLVGSSYWYGKSQAFLNFEVYPTASYGGITNIPQLSAYSNSQENLLMGSVHDSNPIKLQKNTVYQFSLYSKASATNTSDSILYAYFLSGMDKIKIAEINSLSNFGANKKYTYTFFNDIERYGTIILVPVIGSWNISNISLAPYQSIDYSPDSFKIKVPAPVMFANELYEIEAELYDEDGKLAYGNNSYTFSYNKSFLPLKKQVYIDPLGKTLTNGGG